MRELHDSEITLGDLMKKIHRYTTSLAVYVVCDGYEFKDGADKRVVRKTKEGFLTRDAFSSDIEYQRMIRYYSELPVWNLHVIYECGLIDRRNGIVKGIFGAIQANCHQIDIAPLMIKELDDAERERKLAKNEKEGN